MELYPLNKLYKTIYSWLDATLSRYRSREGSHEIGSMLIAAWGESDIRVVAYISFNILCVRLCMKYMVVDTRIIECLFCYL